LVSTFHCSLTEGSQQLGSFNRPPEWRFAVQFQPFHCSLTEGSQQLGFSTVPPQWRFAVQSQPFHCSLTEGSQQLGFSTVLHNGGSAVRFGFSVIPLLPRRGISAVRLQGIGHSQLQFTPFGHARRYTLPSIITS
jgi:hypothetical protein